jgi:predicted RecB family nuclease
MIATPPTLSKSRFLSGLQCPLRLWYQCYNRTLASQITPLQQAIFDMGHEVGILATELFPGGILISEDHLHHEGAVASTIKAIHNRDKGVLFEAAFLENGVRVRADILEQRMDKRWNLIEVKSATSVKDEYLTDVAIQYHVLKTAGLDLDRVFLMHINREYVFDGKQLDLKKLFTLGDVTSNTIRLQNFVQENLIELKAMLSRSRAPDVEPSRHCHRPHTCEFWEHCTRNRPKNWIFDLTGIRQERMIELSAKGINRINEIPDTFPLSSIQQRIRSCIVESRTYLSKELSALLGDVKYPVHFLDFETVSPAIPRYAGTRPYQTIPFQWSDHILSDDGKITHQEYLCSEDKDPRNEFGRTLLDTLGSSGTIFIYTDYEKRIVNQLAEDLPGHRIELLKTVDRFKDLCAIIKKNFYHPEFHGSFSLKSVLPALIPEMSYATLTIQEGAFASVEYLRMINPSTPNEEKQKIRKSLLTYCGHDTLAMLRIRDEIIKRCKA